MGTEGSGSSRAGGEGFHNEDAFRVEDGLGLYVVCDGASATPAGEVAARVASDALEQYVERAAGAGALRGGPAIRAVVEAAMAHAIRGVEEAAATRPELRGLATTITLLLAHEDLGVIGHRGDSRAYLIRRDRAQQLTVDHALAESSERGDAGASRGFDVFSLVLEPGDTVVLCTDGAEEVLDDRALVRTAGQLSPRLLASRIVSAAHRRNPACDATVVAVRVRRAQEPGWLELSAPAQGTTFGHTLERGGRRSPGERAGSGRSGRSGAERRPR
jgi:protein phosphatase